MNLVGAQIGKYCITKQLGAGAFGTVCLAKDIHLNADKAVKILPVISPTDYLQKINEAQILDKCRHKNIISIKEANVIDFSGNPILIIDIEFADGGSIESLMQKEWFSLKKSVNVIIEALFGLDHAHTQGFLHRDIKPANILMAKGCVKLSDFGLAQYAVSGYGGPEGYCSHLPPECYKSGKTSFLTDVYAMGVTLFRIVNNINDWRSRLASIPKCRDVIEKGTLLKKIGFELFVPDQLRRIISKACNPDPTKRYQSAQEMQQALDKLKFKREWIFTGYHHWICNEEKNAYKMDLIHNKKGYNVLYLKNERQQRNLCKSFSSELEAINYMKKIVCDESL